MNYYTLFIILQIYCLHHAYTHRRDWFWYMIIILVPLVGSLLYLFRFLVTPQNTSTIAEKVKGAVNSNYEIEELLRQAKYSDTISNRILLADKYAAKREYLQAIALYESCLTGFNSDDLSTSEKLMVARYFIDDFAEVIRIGDKLELQPLFRHSESRILYAWSLYFMDDNERAEEIFRDMDIRFGNYVHRTEYAKFLLENNRKHEAKDLLTDLLDELSSMSRNERAQKKGIEREINNILRTIR